MSNECPDKKSIAVFLLVPFCLTASHYLREDDFVIALSRQWGCTGLANTMQEWFWYHKDARLYRLLYWILSIDLFYLFVPLLFIRFALKVPFSTYGLRFNMTRRDVGIYLLMLVFMLPIVWFFSKSQSFQDKYPFYSPNPGESQAKFCLWEVFYLTHFFAVEFFFRGFMVNGLKPALGVYAIYVMTIPYCMIHFGKPLPETIAAIAAGLVLGYLSYRGKSIFTGFLIHITVALCMDMAAL